MSQRLGYYPPKADTLRRLPTLLAGELIDLKLEGPRVRYWLAHDSEWVLVENLVAGEWLITNRYEGDGQA